MKLAAGILIAASIVSAQTTVPVENDKVKVLHVVQAPHNKTRLHKHDMNRVMIYLQAGKQVIEYEGGKRVELNWKDAEVLWSPLAGMHTAEIVSDKPVTIVELELKNKGTKQKVTAPKDPVKIDPKHYKVEFENDQVRVIRAKIGPKQSVPMHDHPLDRVVVYVTDQDFRVTDSSGKVSNAKHKAGDVSFSGPASHSEENLSDKAFEIIAVELKG